ncbi:hypothetical protein KC352_g36875, partial [Hortaea werneckii]
MARLNTRTSNAPSRQCDSITPTPGDSDQENRDPSATPAHSRKNHTTDMPPPTQSRRSRNTLPTPTSDPSDAPHSGQKRKRNGDQIPLTDDERREAQYRRFYDPNQN